jgi:predicted dehydrogenase
MIHVGVIGAGYIGPIHIEALNRVSGVRVKALADVNQELARTVADRYNIGAVYKDADALLDDPEITVIHNCTPNRFHFEINKKAIEKGKHVMSEKPLAMTYAQAQELVDLAERHGIVNGIDFCYRYYPAVLEMALRLKRGDAGDVRTVCGSYFQDWLSSPNDWTWRLLKSESGESNIAADLGSHWIDLVQFATGLKVVEVMADFATIIPVRQRPRKQVLAFESASGSATEVAAVELEEYAAILFSLSNGARGSFVTCQTCIGRKSDTEFQVYGSKKSYAWNHKRSTELWIGNRPAPNETLIEGPALVDPSLARYATLPGGHPLGYHDAVLNLFRDFYDVVRNNGNETAPVPRPTFKTGCDEMRILDAVVRSKNSRSWTNVDW